MDDENSAVPNHLINFNEHVQEKDIEIKLEHLSHHQKVEIEKLMDRHKSVFAKDKYDIGTVKEYEARIDLLVDKYCSKRPYRCTIDDKKEIEEQISKLLDRKLIEESYSPFAAPVTLVFKKEENKKSRLCIDFRDLNKTVVPQAQPFPLIEDLMPILEIFDQNLPINIYTDASLEGVGAILKQKQPDGKEKPVAYYSKKLNETQKKTKSYIFGMPGNQRSSEILAVLAHRKNLHGILRS
ncbi:uncharacterized protein LOC124181971 [Neodiprion fabricii]|uniref:uncharacterized protein LOC124181971 n=1 Tax=Neodiprion fabricii TaxID=2872261 RepID=UPI001ED8F28F|nr:uncharacterized protein LOC124181971 [Neodiprion fabricii]